MSLTATLLALFLFTSGSATPAAAVEWIDLTTYDFGDILKGTPVEANFRFRNTGDEALIIDNVRPSCGCTTPDWPRGVILPDSTASIRVEYSAGTPGPFQKLIKVYFKGQRRAEKLYVEGYVVAP